MTVDTKPTREHIIDIAFDLFITKGYHGTSMRDIATAADLAVSGIYNHFSNKEALFEAIIRRWHPFVRMQPELEGVTGDTVRERLADSIQRVIASYDANPKTYHLLFIEIVEFDARHLPQLFSELQPAIRTWVAQLIAADGQVREEAPESLFQWLMSVLFAYFTATHIMNQRVDLDNFIAMYVDGMIQ